jgi:hypothetical protein
MSDPRLNSVHLEFPRREDFRRARGALLDARGMHTIAVEKHCEFANRGDSNTYVESDGNRASPPADYWLADQGAIYPLKVGVNTIGRLTDNDVVIPGPYVSRRHCAILVHAEECPELYDIASKNGTFVNGLKLNGSTHLASGDEIRMCDREFVFMSKFGRGDEPGHESTYAK